MRLFVKSIAISFTILLAPPPMAHAQTTDTIVVFDGSGSMWGQINGRSKIEIARETLSSVLTEVPGQTRIGMIAYGHRQKGVCSDIETVVPVGAADQSVPRMIDVANGLSPKGKTPLSDAVRIAANELKFTENAATVILVTDGIETCNADPCALATELENAGIGFTAHVVGFGLSEEEGKQVQCLADNTGGLYLSANNADELGNALRQTVQAQEIPPSDDDFGPSISVARNVRFILRDTPDGEQIGIRQLSGMLQASDGSAVDGAEFAFGYPEASGNSATALLEPGSYSLALTRDGGARGGYSVNYAFEIPEGDGEFVIEASLSGSLTINPFINPNLPYDPNNPPRGAVKSSAVAYFSVYPVEGGQVAEEPVVNAAYNKLTFPLPSGTYLVRGNIDRTTSAEQLVEVNGVTTVDFSFDATRVFVEAVETNGAQVKRQTTFWYDKVPSGRNYWRGGGGVSKGEVTPFYLPTGTWITNVGGEGYGKRRSQVVVDVPGDFQDIRLRIGEGEQLSADEQGFFASPAYQGCVEITKVKYSGCLVKRANLSGSEQEPTPEPAPAPAPMPTPELPSNSDDNKAGLEGLSGNAYAFVDETGNPLVHVVFSSQNSDDALIVLADSWCGVSQCKADRISTAFDNVDHLLADGFSAKSFGANGYRFDISTFGTDKEVLISGSGASRVAFTFMDVITLEPSAQTPASVPAPPTSPSAEPVSLTDRINRVYGVFNLVQGGGNLDEIVGDFMHTQQCQRRQTVIWPDGAIAIKRFEPPKNATENPFKIEAAGTCEMSGANFDCNLTQADTGAQERLAFTSTLIGNNHYSLQEKGESSATIAASCFYPGGETLASTVMPNGRTLGDMMIERPDGAAPGMGYDKNNNVFDGR